MATSQVILTEAISSLGAEADIVKVRSGYARNFLIPSGKGLEVTPTTLRKINHLKIKRVEREARELTEAEQLALKINKLSFVMKLDTGLQGKTFGSITANDLIERLTAELENVTIPRHAIVLDRPIKEGGDKSISVRLHPEVTATLHITVQSAPKVERRVDDEEEHDSRGRHSYRDAVAEEVAAE
ncbi:MAG: 50S ribosomal protein L9 [Verrucomicrobia bacterium RIFCSPHIGHO2_12_FULL_41_10]|nr:MAG: 50S ribosomal protein L9 [Verrucomicrobia bacterium RIFCSPHIGHO2_12_FULL_41_10]HLB34714.1 50S ribosomal protein L9 [Chthoniobacterales bacterium]